MKNKKRKNIKNNTRKKKEEGFDFKYTKMLFILLLSLGVLSFIGQEFFWGVIAKKEEVIITQDDTTNIYDKSDFLTEDNKKSIEKSIAVLKDNGIDFNVLILPMIGKRNLKDYSDELVKEWDTPKDLVGSGFLIFVIYDGELRIVFDNNISTFFTNDKIMKVLNNNSDNLENNIQTGLVNVIKDLSDISNILEL